jgi:hypothetical protein
MSKMREQFEEALKKNPDARFWNTTDAMFWAWQAALSQPAAVEGWKLVPVEPTDAMTYIGQTLRYDSANSIGDIYRNMLSAAPTPPSAPSAPVQQSVREAFEERFKATSGLLDAEHYLLRDANDQYIESMTAGYWEWWQAALSTSPLLDKNDQTEGDPVDIDCTNMDAAHWAKAFCEKFPGHDEGLMLAWFASAIMCGWDNAHWKIKESNPQPDSNELMELRRDAERYRYLRMSPANEWKVYRWDTKVNCYRGRDGRDLDNAIDAALAQSPSKKGGE